MKKILIVTVLLIISTFQVNAQLEKLDSLKTHPDINSINLSILCLEFLKNTLNYSMYSMHTIDILFLSLIIV